MGKNYSGILNIAKSGLKSVEWEPGQSYLGGTLKLGEKERGRQGREDID